MTVYNTTMFVGTSGTSVTDAIRGAIERAGASLEDLQWFEVKEIRGRIAENEVAEFQVKVEVGYTLHAPTNGGSNKGAAKGTTGARQTRSAAAQIARKGGDKKRTDLAKGFEKQAGRRKAQK